MKLELPPALDAALERVRKAGGRPFVVGGAVRDAVLGRPLKDFDIEVFGLAQERLQEVLGSLGRIDVVGEAFTVYKLSGLFGVDGAVDVSIPRRDSKTGSGHRGIQVTGDPALSLVEASRRRDFTMNAMMHDPQSGELLDPHGGRRDLAAKVLRAVDPATFGEDPLRALRAVQFAARFDLAVEENTARLCASMPIGELPAERVFGEIEKLLLGAPRPSRGFELLKAWGMLTHVCAELVPLDTTEQDPQWHPEGDVWIHTMQVIDEAASLIADLDHPRALTVMIAALCHDLGKPATTRFQDGRLRSRGHEEAGIPPTVSLLDRWKIHKLHGFDVRGQVLALVAHHLKPGQLYDHRERVTDGAIRRLAGKCEADLLYRVARADCLGRKPGHFEPVAMEWFRDKVRDLAVEKKPPAPLLRGRDVVALGVPPGPAVGRIVEAVYERQLDGVIVTAEEAKEEARRLLESLK